MAMTTFKKKVLDRTGEAVSSGMAGLYTRRFLTDRYNTIRK
jgi:hypothetical protein